MNSTRADLIPQCSILIANYNGAEIIQDCVDSILAQEGDVRYEIIIYDDASTDDSLQLLSDLYPKNQYPQVNVIAGKDNVGFCVGNNRMAEASRGEFLLLLNNDAALAPDALQTLMQAAHKQTPKGVLTLPQLDWETGRLVDRGSLLDPFYNPVPNIDPERKDVAFVIGACLWIPKNLWKNLGGFPVWFESIGEDLFLCCYARLTGHPVQVTQESHYRHRQGASFGGNKIQGNRLSTTYRRRRLSERNKTYTMIICSPPVQLWLTLPIHLSLLAIEGILLGAIKRDWRIWKEIYLNIFSSLYDNRTTLQQKRKLIQSNRTMSTTKFGGQFLRPPHKLTMLLRFGLPKLQ